MTQSNNTHENLINQAEELSYKLASYRIHSYANGNRLREVSRKALIRYERRLKTSLNRF